MYAQSFFVTSVRGTALVPITSDSAGLGVIGFMNAAFGFLFAVFLAIKLSPLNKPRSESARECTKRNTNAQVFPMRIGDLHRGNGLISPPPRPRRPSTRRR